MAPVLSAAKLISGFIGRHTPAIAKAITACRKQMRLGSPKDLSLPAAKRLVERALAPQREAFARAPRLTTITRSISAKQRPRRPPEIKS